MTQAPTPNPSTNPGDRSIFGPVHLTRAIIIITAILCAVLFYYAARWIGWPSEPGFGGSMAQSKALLSFVVAIVLLIVCTIVGTVIAGSRWFLAGLLAATTGLATWSVRGGTMTPVLFNAENTGVGQAVYFQMLWELIIFFAVIAGLWNLIWTSNAEVTGKGLNTIGRVRLSAVARDLAIGTVFGAVCGRYGSHFVRGQFRTESDYTTREDDASRSTGAALVAQAAIMLLLVMFLAATPLKKQVMTSVFLAGVISTAIAEYFFANRKSGRWYWIAPLLVGVIGYVAGYINPTGLGTGDIQGSFGPLTRVLPLDYASMGCAGVLFGYWWMEPAPADEPPLAAEADVPNKSAKRQAGDAPVDPAADAA